MESKIPRLITALKTDKIIFVGDTHGDLNASTRVVSTYLKPGNILVFLGDYVDRGPSSKDNLDFLLQKKQQFPNQIYLLMGNHEGHRIEWFLPLDFWKGLAPSEYEKYASIVESFPFAFTCGCVIALHGVLPDVRNLQEINNIILGSKEWQQICWGDFLDKDGEFFGDYYGRLRFGRDWFLKLMNRFNARVLIRAHQPDCPEIMFNNRCLTIFTSSAYGRKRTIAILDTHKEIKSVNDLEIVEI